MATPPSPPRPSPISEAAVEPLVLDPVSFIGGADTYHGSDGGTQDSGSDPDSPAAGGSVSTTDSGGSDTAVSASWGCWEYSCDPIVDWRETKEVQ